MKATQNLNIIILVNLNIIISVKLLQYAIKISIINSSILCSSKGYP